MSAHAVSLTKPQENTNIRALSEYKKKSLNRYISLQPEKAAISHARLEKIWKISAVASLVAFVLIAAVATIFVSLLAAPYIPLVAISALCLAPYAYQRCYLKMRHCSEEHRRNASIERGVAKELKNLPSNDTHLKALLPHSAQKLPFSSLSQLKPTIARLLYLEKLSDELQTEAREKFDSSQRVHQEFEKDSAKIRRERIETLDLFEEAQIAKVKAAFILAVLHNPSLPGDFNNNERFTFKIVHPAERLLRKAFADPSAGILVQRKDKSSLGIEQLQRMSVEQVYRQLF